MSDTIASAAIPADRIAHEYNYYKWVALLGVTFCYLFYYTGRQTFGFAIPGIQAELGLSKAMLGWVSAGMLWAYALGQSVNGNLGDKFGGRTMMFAGAVLSYLANFGTSFATGVVGLAIFWGLNGYFQAMGFAPGSRLISNWWGHRSRGFVYSFFIGGASFSSVIAFALPVIMLQYFGMGWRDIFRYAPLLMVFGAFVMYFAVRERPEDVGLKSPEDDVSPADAANASNAIDTEYATSKDRYKAVLSNWRLYAVAVSIGFQNAARYALLIWVPVHFFGAGWKSSAGGIDPIWLTLALPLGMAVGALTNAWLSDVVFKSRRYIAIMTYMLLATVISLVMMKISHDSVLGLIAILLCGFFVFGPASSFWALCPDIFGRRLAGTATGCVNFVSYAFAGLGEPIIGHLMDKSGSTVVIFPIVPILCVASAVSSLIIRR